MPSLAVTVAAASMSSKLSPGMNFVTARRMNGTRVPLARSHWLSETFNSTVRATLMRLTSYCAHARWNRLLFGLLGDGHGLVGFRRGFGADAIAGRRQRMKRTNARQLRPHRA